MPNPLIVTARHTTHADYLTSANHAARARAHEIAVATEFPSRFSAQDQRSRIVRKPHSIIEQCSPVVNARTRAEQSSQARSIPLCVSYTVRTMIPQIVSSMPATFFQVSGSPAKMIPINAPNSGEVNAIGITRLSGAPLIAA